MAGRLNSTRGTSKSMKDDDLESVTSFASGPVSTKPTVKYAWSGNFQIDHDAYHRMLEDYRTAKAKENKDELKIKQLAAQLARTEEAAKRALLRSDQGVKGNTAQQLLDAQRQIQLLQAENSELSSKLAREKKRANDFRSAAEENRRRLEAALKEQRSLVRRLGEAERSLGGSTAARSAARKAAAEQEHWSEEAGRRFAVQQEELVALREQTKALQEQLAAAVPADTASRYEATIKELQQLVRFYEQRLTATGAAAGVDALGPVGASAGQNAKGCCGNWVLESLTEGGACYLWERSTGHVMTDVPDGLWPRPVGIKLAATSPVQLGCKGRLDAALRALADVLNHRSQSPTSSRNRPAESCSKLDDALQQLINKGGCVSGSYSSVSAGVVDSRDLPAFMVTLLPAAAYREVVELLSWLRVQQGQQAVMLDELEASARSLLSARDAVRQGRDLTVNEALLRVRRLLRQEPSAVAAAFDEAAGQDGCLATMQVVELLQQQLLPDLMAAEAQYLLVLLHEWDLAASSRHSLTTVYAALQLPKLVRVPVGALPQTAGPDRPDSGQSTTSTNVTSSSAVTPQATPAPSKERVFAGKQSWTAAPAPGNRKSNGSGCLSNTAAGTLAGSIASLKEAYLTDRVASLEAELAAAKAGVGTASSQQVDALRNEIARYQARLAELENDFLSLDVVAHTEVGDYDAEMRKAWFTAAAFKKRYVEHKMELDAIKATAEKMQKGLDETHSALHAEAARRMALEEAAAMAKMEAARTKELAAAVAAERAERLKLEKDYLELQSKAFAAPGGALAEVRSLREELLAARRERAMTEAREAELRREISSLKRQLEGVSPEEHCRLVRELGEAQRKLVSCELELRAALDKLEVYRRADNTAAAASAAAAVATPGGFAGVGSLEKSLQPDEGKTEAELRSELAQLRQAMSLEAGELGKLRKLLDTEAYISLAAKAALEEAQAALSAAKAEAAQQVAKLRRELDGRDERIRKLEAQLRGAYSGLSKAAMRASTAAAADKGSCGVRVSRVGLGAVRQSTEDVLQELGLHENVIELVVAEAELTASTLTPAASTFLAWDFFLHDSQATPLAASPSPTYNTTVQYIVEVDTFLMEYLSQQQLAFELFEARGWDAVAIGVSRLPLRLLLQDLEVGAGVGAQRAWHHVDITGATGQQIGRLRVGLRIAKPMDKLMMEYREAQQQKQTSAATPAAGTAANAGAGAATDLRDIATQQQQQQLLDTGAGGLEALARVLHEAADQADAEPSKASHLLISIHRCEGLQKQQQQEEASPATSTPPVQSPYVHYTAPGRLHSHDTAVGSGASPVFEDAASWGLVKSRDVENALARHQLQVAVFDDAAADPVSALLGMASISLASLAEGIPVEGLFGVINPHTGQQAGRVAVTIAWHNPLAAAAAGTKQLKARIPLLDSAAAAESLAAKAAAAHSTTSTLQLQQQMAWTQHQQQVLLPSVPMLTVDTNSGNQISLLGTSNAAAAAIAASIGRQQQQQSQVPLLQGGAAGDPAAAFAAAATHHAAVPGRMLLLQGQQVASVSSSSLHHRYNSVTALSQSLDGPLQTSNAAAAAVMIGQSLHLQAPAVLQVAAEASAISVTGSSNSSALPPVMRQVDPASDVWCNFESTIYFKIECLELTDDALRDPGLQNVLVAHMFLEDFTSAAQQCTATVAKGPGTLDFSYCVAYTVADPVSNVPTAAGRALAQAFAAADAGQAARLVLPILLATSNSPAVTDFSQVECVSTCEVDLSDVWQGAAGDIVSKEYVMVAADERAAQYPSGSTGTVRITLAAARALANLRQHTYG